MATDMERHYREVLARMELGDKHFDLLDRQYRELRAALQLDCLDFDRFPKTETKVKEELARQADRYIEFGLNGHRQINMEQGKFKDSLIALACFQLENFAGRFDIPVAVLGQVPAKDIYKAAGVDYQLGDLDVRDWPDDPQGYVTPQRFYLSWMDTGVFNLDRKVEDVRTNLAPDMRGAQESDGSGLYVAHPRILEHHYVDFPGTSVGSGRAPYLHLFIGRPEVGYDWVDCAYPEFGSALCGRD